jgi:hypothetical protein
MTLYRIQEDTEDPFDMTGVDDLNLGMLSEVQYHFFEAPVPPKAEPEVRFS